MAIAYFFPFSNGHTIPSLTPAGARREKRRRGISHFLKHFPPSFISAPYLRKEVQIYGSLRFRILLIFSHFNEEYLKKIQLPPSVLVQNDGRFFFAHVLIFGGEKCSISGVTNVTGN